MPSASDGLATVSEVAAKPLFGTSAGTEVADLEAVVHSSWAQLSARFTDMDATNSIAVTPFQSGGWLQAWYDTVGAQPGIEPLPLEIRNAQTGEPVFGIPLVKRKLGSQCIAEFADASVTDYNAPLIGPGWVGKPPNSQRKGEGAEVTPQRLMKLLQEPLQDCDQLQFRKMPTQLFGTPNPFALMPGNQVCAVGSNLVRIDGSWADYRKSLAKKVRKELERSFRVFQRDGIDAHFCVVNDPAEALAILEQMEILQEQRISELGLPFLLNEPEYAAFYRRLIELDLASGRLLLTVLKSGPDEVVGALLGLLSGSNYAMIRLAHGGKSWSHCSPGKLMIDQTMQYLHTLGVTSFDFTTGDYSYKKGFLPHSEPLVDVYLGVSFKGRISLASSQYTDAAKDRLRRFPLAFDLMKKLALR